MVSCLHKLGTLLDLSACSCTLKLGTLLDLCAPLLNQNHGTLLYLCTGTPPLAKSGQISVPSPSENKTFSAFPQNGHFDLQLKPPFTSSLGVLKSV